MKRRAGSDLCASCRHVRSARAAVTRHQARADRIGVPGQPACQRPAQGRGERALGFADGGRFSASIAERHEPRALCAPRIAEPRRRRPRVAFSGRRAAKRDARPRDWRRLLRCARRASRRAKPSANAAALRRALARGLTGHADAVRSRLMTGHAARATADMPQLAQRSTPPPLMLSVHSAQARSARFSAPTIWELGHRRSRSSRAPRAHAISMIRDPRAIVAGRRTESPPQRGLDFIPARARVRFAPVP